MTDQKEHVLILNIGGSPLPNYIVALYSLRGNNSNIKKPSKIILIYSKETDKFATRIIQKLIESVPNLNGRIDRIPIGENSRNLDQILRKLENSALVNGILNKNIASIHLNITGATKEMMLASFMIIKAVAANDKDLEFIISDLNPETYKIELYSVKITIENKLALDEIQNNGLDLREELLVDVDILLKLHIGNFKKRILNKNDWFENAIWNILEKKKE